MPSVLVPVMIRHWLKVRTHRCLVAAADAIQLKMGYGTIHPENWPHFVSFVILTYSDDFFSVCQILSSEFWASSSMWIWASSPHPCDLTVPFCCVCVTHWHLSQCSYSSVILPLPPFPVFPLSLSPPSFSPLNSAVPVSLPYLSWKIYLITRDRNPRWDPQYHTRPPWLPAGLRRTGLWSSRASAPRTRRGCPLPLDP